jgi:hypothetical protein
MITALPEVLQDKIHGLSHDCTAVGLLLANNDQCPQNSVPVHTTNLMKEPHQTRITCCRPLNNFNSYFSAKQSNYNDLARNILASLTPAEATETHINTLMASGQAHTVERRRDIVTALLRHVNIPIQITLQAKQNAFIRPIILQKLLAISNTSYADIKVLIAYAIDNHLANINPQDPLERNQYWKRYDGTLKIVDEYNCPEEFGGLLRGLLSDLQGITLIESPPISIPSKPGIVIQFQDSRYEHCSYPILFLLLEHLHTQPAQPVALIENNSILTSFCKFIRTAPFIDQTIFEKFWQHCLTYNPSQIYSKVLASALVTKDEFIKEHVRTLCAKEQNFKLHFVDISMVVMQTNLGNDEKNSIITELLSMPQKPSLNCDDIVLLVRTDYWNHISYWNPLEFLSNLINECSIQLNDTQSFNFCIIRCLTEIFAFPMQRFQRCLHALQRIMAKANVHSTSINSPMVPKLGINQYDDKVRHLERIGIYLTTQMTTRRSQ